MSARVHSGGTFSCFRPRLIAWMSVLSIFWAATAVAQLGGGTGWGSLPVEFKVQSPTNAPESDRYWATNNIYHCEVFSTDGAFEAGNTTLPRTEQRFEPDYTNGGNIPIGEIQYQSMEMAPSNENSYCIFQIHTGDAESPQYGSTTFMLFWFTNDNGSVRDYSGTELAGDLGNRWFQLNVDHNLVAHAIKVWVNQQLVWTQSDNGAGDFYFKDGVYEQDHGPTLRMDAYLTNILMWTNSGSPVVPLTWTGQMDGTNNNVWDIDAETNWVNSTNGTLQFYQNGSPVTFDDSASGTSLLNLDGAVEPGMMTVSNSLKNYSFAGGGSIGGMSLLLKEGSGTLTNGTANTFTGGVDLNGGILDVDAVETPGVSGPLGESGTVAFNGGTLQYDSSGVDTADYSSRFSAAPGQEYCIDVPLRAGSDYSGALTITYASALSSTDSTLIKNGGGSLALNAANSFTGSIWVNSGQLRANNAGAFNSNPIFETSGAQIYHNSAGTYGSDYRIAGEGVAESDGVTHLGAIRLATAGIILSNTITLTGNAGISTRGSGTTGDAITGQITGNYGIQFGGTSTTTSAGNGTLTLYNALNDWTGDTTIADGTLKLGASWVIPSGIGYGDLVLTNAGTNFNPEIADTVFDLNGFSQTVNGLLSAGGITGNALNMLWITNSGNSTAVLTVGSADSPGSFGGIIGGDVALVKVGSGTQTLGGVNTYSGGTTVSAGTLALTGGGSIANSPSIVVDGAATLDVSRLPTGFALGPGQTLGNAAGAAYINGNIATGSGTLSFSVPGFPALLVTNGAMTLSSSGTVKINNTGSALPAGMYPLIEGAAAGRQGYLFGSSPSSVVVTGNGIAPGATASLKMEGNALELVVTLSVPRISAILLNGSELTLETTNGPFGGQFVLLESTNIALPLSQWTPVLTNEFDMNGGASFSTLVNRSNAEQFYILAQ